jgi:hypothetical protein
VCMWRATYHWKALDKAYNFALDLTSIKGLHIKLWAFKVTKIPILGISRFPLGNLRTKWHLGVGPVAKHRVYYKGEGSGFPRFGPWWILWVRVCLWLVHAPKVLQFCTNQLVVWFVHILVNNWTTYRSL